MKTKRQLLFILMSIANYVLILLAVLGYRLSGGLLLVFLIFQIGLSFANAFTAQKLYQFIILNIHLLISTLIALPTEILLHYHYDGDLPETLLSIPFITVAGCVAVIGSSVVAFIVNKKRLESNEKISSRCSTTIIISSIIIWVIVITALIVAVMPREMHISDAQNAYITYHHGEAEIYKPLSEDDALAIVNLYDGKQLSVFTESCAFTDDILISFGEQRFRIATDGNGTIQYNGKYIDLAGLDRTRLRNILYKYGAKLPCLEYRTLF